MSAQEERIAAEVAACAGTGTGQSDGGEMAVRPGELQQRVTQLEAENANLRALLAQTQEELTDRITSLYTLANVATMSKNRRRILSEIRRMQVFGLLLIPTEPTGSSYQDSDDEDESEKERGREREKKGKRTKRRVGFHGDVQVRVYCGKAAPTAQGVELTTEDRKPRAPSRPPRFRGKLREKIECILEQYGGAEGMIEWADDEEKEGQKEREREEEGLGVDMGAAGFENEQIGKTEAANDSGTGFGEANDYQTGPGAGDEPDMESEGDIDREFGHESDVESDNGDSGDDEDDEDNEDDEGDEDDEDDVPFVEFSSGDLLFL